MDFKKDKEDFKELLDNEYSWPASYTFKFIVAAAKESDVRNLFDAKAEIALKPSSGGKYTSVTISAKMDSSDEIVKIYEQAAQIEGIISL